MTIHDLEQFIIMAFLPAIVINAIIAALTCQQWVKQILCFVLSLIISGIYAIFSNYERHVLINHTFAIIGVSYFLYSLGGFNFLKKITSVIIERRNNEKK